MTRYAQLVMGPAGTGKSTYCTTIQSHCAAIRRPNVHVINLDPAAEEEVIAYQPSADICELISVEDVVEEIGLGPNGALVYCMEYLEKNLEWLEEVVEELGDDPYVIFDLPGQIELYR